MRKLLPITALALLALLTPLAPAATATEVDLAAATVEGHRLLGTVAGVTAALGKPTWRLVGSGAYRIGYGRRADFSAMVIFDRHGGRFRARTIVLERPPVYEARIA